MKYDFVSIPDRAGTGSSKWDAVGGTVEHVPLSVADMEFPTAPPIKEALVNLVENRILGYACPTEEYFDATISWMKRRHNFDVKKEWFLSTPGVIPALSILIQTVTKPGDAIILLTPVYYPFDMVTIANGRRLVYSKLLNVDGRYEIDYADLTEKAKLPEAKAILFSNPHNPVSRVWTRDLSAQFEIGRIYLLDLRHIDAVRLCRIDLSLPCANGRMQTYGGQMCRQFALVGTPLAVVEESLAIQLHVIHIAYADYTATLIHTINRKLQCYRLHQTVVAALLGCCTCQICHQTVARSVNRGLCSERKCSLSARYDNARYSIALFERVADGALQIYVDIRMADKLRQFVLRLLDIVSAPRLANHIVLRHAE